MPNLLIVDDQSPILKDTIAYFSIEKWSVTGAASGEACLDLVNPSFDAVVLDLRLPGMQGEDVLAKIRARSDLDSVCIVVLTAYGEIDSAVRSLRRGAYQYLQKPFALADLKRILVSGIALQKANALRHSLLVSQSSGATLDAIRSILSETLNAGGVYVLFLGPDGAVERVAGATAEAGGARVKRFVSRIIAANGPIFESCAERVADLDPVMPAAQSLLAAPVFAVGGSIVGVLDIESTLPDAFDRNWIDVVSYLSDLVGISRELRAKQQLLVEREQWREIPIIVGELRHQISNPAQAIDMCAKEFASKELKAKSLPKALGERMERRMGVIGRNADAIKKVCAYLGDISIDIPLDKRRFKLLALLEDCLDEVRTELADKHVALTLESTKKDGVMLDADENRVRYCIQCLLRNAIEAIDERRAQDLRTDFDAAQAGDRIEVRLDGGSATTVAVSIADTGIGILPENQERVFRPLFTTKQRRAEPGGIGLFSVKRIMNKHDGTVTFDQQRLTGAVFTLSFPKR